jgi:hypothetical protein
MRHKAAGLIGQQINGGGGEVRVRASVCWVGRRRCMGVAVVRRRCGGGAASVDKRRARLEAASCWWRRRVATTCLNGRRVTASHVAVVSFHDGVTHCTLGRS